MSGQSNETEWSLERQSCGQLAWQKNSPTSKVRFRFDIEVLEYEKQPHEDLYNDYIGVSFKQISSSLAFGATCLIAVAVSVLFPWYIIQNIDII